MPPQSARPGDDVTSRQTAPITDGPTPRYHWVLLLLALAVSLAVRWSFLGERWINPDEGAHLMDAALILRGFIPEVDFGTRQPLYVYALAGVLDVFGSTLTVGRLLPLACSLATGLVIYLLGAELVDRRVGLLSAVVYLLLPLEMLQSVVVKTEAPVTLLVVSSLYAAVAGHRRRRGYLFVVAGILAGLGYYVRETALLVPIVVVAFLLFSVPESERRRSVLTSVGLFFAGYVAVVLVTMLYYAPHLGMNQLWELTPAAFVLGAAGQFVRQAVGPGSSAVIPEHAGTGTESWTGYGEPVELHLAYLQDALDFHSFLLVGMVLAALVLFRGKDETVASGDTAARQRDRVALGVAYVWLGVLGGMYVYRYVTRGFFIDYFREFLPPLVLLLGLWLGRAVPALREDRNAAKLIAAAVPTGAAWFLVQARFPDEFGLGHHATLAMALLALFVVTLSGKWGRRRAGFGALLATIAAWIVVSRQLWPSPFSGIVPSVVTAVLLLTIVAGWYRLGSEDVIRKTTRFAGFSLVAVALALSLSHGARRLGLNYEAVWPPEEVGRIAEVIERHTDDEAEVLSGAVIWEFTAGRRPFQLISHPLGLKRAASADLRTRLREALLEHPPEIVVMDGYTEVTYARNVPLLDSLVRQRYERVAASSEGARPVTVFLRLEPGSDDSASMVE